MLIKRVDGLKRYTITTEYGQTSIHAAGELLDYVNVTDLIEAWYKPEEQKRLTRKVVLGILKEHNFKVLKYKNDLYISAGRVDDFTWGIYQKTDINDKFTKKNHTRYGYHI